MRIRTITTLSAHADAKCRLPPVCPPHSSIKNTEEGSVQLRVGLVDANDTKTLKEGGGQASRWDGTSLQILFEVEDTGKGVPEQ